MDESWAIVVASALTGTFALLGAGVPKVVDAIRERNESRSRTAAKKAAVFERLRRVYLAARELLQHTDEPIWVDIIAAAADCIPYTEPDSEARKVLVDIIGRRHVDVDRFIAVLP